MALSIGKLVGYLDLDDSKFDSKLGSAEGKFSKFGGAMAKAVAAGTVAATAAVAGFAAHGVREFASFERGMNEIFTLMPGASQATMDALTRDVRKWNVELGIPLEQTLPGIADALGAGIPEENLFDFMTVAAKGAVGGNAELGTSVDALTSIVNAYGQENISASEASDIMFQSILVGKSTMDDMAGSLYDVLPTAAALGVEFSDIGGALAVMTAQGVPTRVAVTQLRNVFVELSKSGGKTAKLFEDLAGKTFKEFVAEGGNTQDALQLLEEHAEKTGVGINDLFSSVESGGAALALTGGNTDAFTQALEEMENSAGATDGAFAQMDQGIDRSMERIKVSFNDAALTVGTALAPAVQQVADGVETAMPRMASAVETAIGAIGAGLGRLPGLLQSSGVQSALDDLRTRAADSVAALGPLWASMQTAAAAVLPLVGSVLKLVASAFGAIVAGALSALPAVIGAFTGLMGAIGPFLSVIRQIVDFITPVLVPVLYFLAQTLMGVVAGAIQGVTRFIQGITNVLQGVINFVKAVFAGEWGAAWDAVKQILLGVFQAIVGAVQVWLNVTVLGIFRGGLLKLASLWKGGLDTLKKWATSAWKGIGNAFSAALKFILNLITGAVKGYISLWTNLFRTVGSIVSNGWAVLRSAFGGALSAIRTMVSQALSAIVNFFRNGLSNARSAVTNGVSAMRTAFSNGMSRIKSAVSSGISDVVGKIKALPGQIKSGIGNLGALLYGAGQDVIRGLINGIKNMAGSAVSAVSGVVGDAIGKAKSLLGINSPSRVFMEIGQFTGEGLAIGLEKEQATVRRAAEALTHIPDDVPIETFVRGDSSLWGQVAARAAATAPQETTHRWSREDLDYLISGFGEYLRDGLEDQGRALARAGRADD